MSSTGDDWLSALTTILFTELLLPLPILSGIGSLSIPASPCCNVFPLLHRTNACCRDGDLFAALIYGEAHDAATASAVTSHFLDTYERGQCPFPLHAEGVNASFDTPACRTGPTTPTCTQDCDYRVPGNQPFLCEAAKITVLTVGIASNHL